MRRVERVLLCAAAVPFGVAALVGTEAAAPEPAEVVLTFTDDRILESSGLVVRDGLVVTVNDSGDENRIFAVDPATGQTVGVTAWPGDAEDIEALAPAGKGEAYVGDIGDNATARETVQLARVPFGRGDREVDAPTYDLAYADGPHDAETVLVHPRTGRVYVVAKEFIGRLYAAPAQLDDTALNRLELVGEVLGTATDGAFLPDGRHVVLRNYTQAVFYTWPGLDRVATLDLPDQQQGEGIAVSAQGEVLVSTEGAHTDVLRVALPDSLRAQLEAPAPGPAESSPPSGDQAPPSGTSGDKTEDRDAVGDRDADEEPWTGILLSPWLIGGVALVVIVAVLVRSLRPR